MVLRTFIHLLIEPIGALLRSGVEQIDLSFDSTTHGKKDSAELAGKISEKWAALNILRKDVVSMIGYHLTHTEADKAAEKSGDSTQGAQAPVLPEEEPYKVPMCC